MSLKLLTLLSTNGGNIMRENKKVKKIKLIENVKVVILDLDNTTWMHRKDEARVVTDALQIPLTKDFEEQYLGMFSEVGKYFAERKMTYGKVIRLVKQCMPVLQQYNMSAEEFVKKWIPIETSFLNEDALEAIKYLKAKGYKIVVLTDWLWECQVPLLKKYGLMPYIDKIYTCDDQYLKKNPKSAARVIEEGCEEDYVIIGDSLKDDIAFANHAGIRSIWFNPEGKVNETGFKPTSEIASMLEVCRIIA